MLVHHRAAAHVVAPVQAPAGGDHRLGEVQHLVAVGVEVVVEFLVEVGLFVVRHGNYLAGKSKSVTDSISV